MTTQRKLQIVQQLSELLSQSNIIIASDYRGLSVAEMSQLRCQLREMGIEYHVVKNTLAKFAAEKVSKPGLSQLLQGPIALAFGYGDITQPAKALADYYRSSKITLSIKGGLLDGQVLSAEEVSSLATLPPPEVLRARLLGVLQSPVFALQNLLSTNLRGLTPTLKARIQQLGGMTDVER